MLHFFPFYPNYKSYRSNFIGLSIKVKSDRTKILIITSIINFVHFKPFTTLYILNKNYCQVMKSGTRELIANVSTDVPSLFVSQLPPSTDFIVTVRSGVGYLVQ